MSLIEDALIYPLVKVQERHELARINQSTYAILKGLGELAGFQANLGGYVLGERTVAQLPAPGAVARVRFEVTNALAPTIGATVTGGGAARVTVRTNGTNWIVTEIL